MRSIEFRSDNSAGVAPEILAALGAANVGSAIAYGADEWTAALHERVANVFEREAVAVFPVVSGTAANALALSAICPPWGAVLCHETAHILNNECGSTSLFGGGAMMIGLTGDDYLVGLDDLERTFAGTRWGDPHASQPSALSLTLPTDYGTVYAPDHVRALAAAAKARGLKVHLDGARLANAIDALGCTPAELTWQAGADIISLGAMKNGALSTDAIVCFDPAVAEQLVYRVKRAGHVASKMRFQSVQLDAYLTDGLWLRMAHTANEAMRRLAAGLAALGITFANRPDVNMLFISLPDAAIDRIEAAGLLFYRMGPGRLRLVTSFQTSLDDVDDAIDRIRRAL